MFHCEIVFSPVVDSESQSMSLTSTTSRESSYLLPTPPHSSATVLGPKLCKLCNQQPCWHARKRALLCICAQFVYSGPSLAKRRVIKWKTQLVPLEWLCKLARTYIVHHCISFMHTHSYGRQDGIWLFPMQLQGPAKTKQRPRYSHSTNVAGFFPLTFLYWSRFFQIQLIKINYSILHCLALQDTSLNPPV